MKQKDLNYIMIAVTLGVKGSTDISYESFVLAIIVSYMTLGMIIAFTSR